MDTITIISIAAGVAGILSLIYLAFIGQKSLPEIWSEWGTRLRKSNNNTILNNLPQSDSEFVDRKKEIEKIQLLLRPYPASNFHFVAIDGIGGVGKTALALEIAHQYLKSAEKTKAKDAFKSILWVSAKESVLTSKGILPRKYSLRTLEDLYSAIGTVLENSEIMTARPEVRERLVQTLLTKQRTLIIVDNIEAVHDNSIETFLRELPAPTKVLVTSRHRVDVAYPVRLENLSWDEAKIIIANECQKKGVSLTETQSQKIFELCGGIPLAIVWSIGLISFGYSVESVIGKLYSADQDIIKFCFSASIEQIRELPSFEVLLSTALFTAGATVEALRFILDDKYTPLEISDFITDLDRLSLISKKDDRINMLPLTFRMARAELEKRSDVSKKYSDRYIKYYRSFVTSNLGKDFWESENYWRNFPLIDPEKENISQAIDLAYHEHRWDDVLSLTIPTVHYLHTRGLFEERLRQAQISIESATELNDLRTVAFIYISSIGWIHIRRSEWQQAEKTILKGLEIARQIAFTDAIVLAHAHLSRVALYQGEIDQSDKYIKDVEAIEVPAVIKCRIHFMKGLIAVKQENWSEAEKQVKIAMNILSTVTDFLWPALYITLADIYMAKDEIDNAEKIYRQSLEFSGKMARITDTADSWFGLAQISYKKENYKQAIEYAQKALGLFKQYRSSIEVEKTQNFIETVKKSRSFYSQWIDRKHN